MKKSLLGVSLFTVTGLYCFLFAFIFLVGLFTGAEMSYVILGSIIGLLIEFLLAPFFTDIVMKWFYKARFDAEMPEHLVRFITVICKQNNMKYPKIGYIDDGAPNAFTYGRTKNDARIVVTRGLIELLRPEEVEAVVAHEIGHAVHYDMAVMTMAQLIPLVLYYCYEIFTSNTDSDNSKLAVLGYVAYILYLLSDYIVLWLSRQREYYADSFSIESTRNPSALAEALVKVGYGLSTRSDRESKKSVSKKNALGIFDSNASKALTIASYGSNGISKDNIMHAMKWEMWNVWAKWYELHSTHPMISKRLKAISARCSEFNQPVYIDFNLQKPESYVDDFLLELVILMLPVFIIIVGVIVFIFTTVISENLEVFRISLSATIIGIMLACLLKLSFTHKNKNYEETTVSNLLSEVKVSGVTSIPCILEGEIIGRGNPGCIFDEDLVIKDETGIMFLDYKHVFRIMDMFAALFKNNTFMNKKVKITGWYRRCPVPYVEIYKIQIEGEDEKVMKSYGVAKFLAYAVIVFSIAVLFI